MEDRTRALRALAKRLHSVIHRHKPQTNPAQIAKALKNEVSAPSIREWITEDKIPTEPGAISLAMVAEHLGVSLDWLLFGNDRAALDVSLLNRLREIRDEHPNAEATENDQAALARDLGQQMIEELRPWPLASELSRDIKLVSDKEIEAHDLELASILKRAPRLIRELQEVEKQWLAFRTKYPVSSRRRRSKAAPTEADGTTA